MAKEPHPTRLFKHPDEIKEVWAAFKLDVKEQAKEWIDVQYAGRNGDEKLSYKKVPLTFEGFKRYCRENDIGEVEQYFTNQGGYYDDFVGICRAIKEEIRENQIIGGMLGFFNPSITQRLNGLTEKTEHTIKEQPLLDDI